MQTVGAVETSLAAAARAFEREVLPLLPSLEGYCRAVARDRWDAEDLAQDTLEKAFLRFKRTGGAPMNKAYLYRIASNAWIDRARRARERVRPDDWPGWASLASEPAETADTRRAVERLVSALTPKQRTVLLLCEAFGLPLQEAADRLGLTVGSAKSLLHRARASLKRLAAAEDEVPAEAPPELVDAYLRALRLGLVGAVVALGAGPAALRLGPSAAANVRRASGRVRRLVPAGCGGFAATSDGACAAVVPRRGGAGLQVLSFRAGDAIAA